MGVRQVLWTNKRCIDQLATAELGYYRSVYDTVAVKEGGGTLHEMCHKRNPKTNKTALDGVMPSHCVGNQLAA